MIPFLDLKLQQAPLREELMRALGEVVDSTAYCGGPSVAAFEEEFAAYCGVRSAVGVGSGSDALWLTLMAMGIGPGDEVVTVPMTFAATVEAICLTGATPVFVDIEPHSYTMDPAALEQVITPRSKAIVPVHLFGQTADMEPILAIARRYRLSVIEDAAQAHGAEYHGRRAGSLGDAGCFSFYPGKNLGAFGEGGAVVTDDASLARRLRMLRNHGQSSKNRHRYIGWNSRLDALQAAVLRVKLGHLDAANQQRRNHALAYGRELAGTPEVILPLAEPGRHHVYHLYAVRVAGRKRVIRALEQRNIGYGLHYPVAVHLQSAYRSLGYQRGDFPVAEACAARFLSLPMFPGMTSDQIAAVAAAVRDAVEEPVAEPVAMAAAC